MIATKSAYYTNHIIAEAKLMPFILWIEKEKDLAWKVIEKEGETMIMVKPPNVI